MEYARLRGEAGSDVSLADLGFQSDLRVYLHLRQTWMAFSEWDWPGAPAPPWEERRVVPRHLAETQHLPTIFTLALPSDHPQCPGGHHNSATYLPEEENSYRHCTDQRSQQVWTCRRAGGGVSPEAAEALIPLSLFSVGP